MQEHRSNVLESRQRDGHLLGYIYIFLNI